MSSSTKMAASDGDCKKSTSYFLLLGLGIIRGIMLSLCCSIAVLESKTSSAIFFEESPADF